MTFPHLFSQGIDGAGRPRPGYDEWRHDQACWCVHEKGTAFRYSPYYRYTYRAADNPPLPSYVKRTAEVIA